MSNNDNKQESDLRQIMISHIKYIQIFCNSKHGC